MRRPRLCAHRPADAPPAPARGHKLPLHLRPWWRPSAGHSPLFPLILVWRSPPRRSGFFFSSSPWFPTARAWFLQRGCANDDCFAFFSCPPLLTAYRCVGSGSAQSPAFFPHTGQRYLRGSLLACFPQRVSPLSVPSCARLSCGRSHQRATCPSPPPSFHPLPRPSISLSLFNPEARQVTSAATS